MPHTHPSAFPPRALDCADDGEGQALALREGEAFFQRTEVSAADSLGSTGVVEAGLD